MKIKRKVQKTLPQLIEWGFENDIKRVTYMSENGLTVDFSFDGKAVIGYAFSKDDLFTITIEEEIDEDTELDLIERFIVNNKTYYTNPQAMSINTCLGVAPDDIITTHFYIENYERELVLIWRDGKLVE